ncbi:MAG TPA: hypothetical protein VGR34_01365 [Candidatus Dormibacteraeota bacterium]|nr:hypothetical protein [Candidatus Dormibacteraeota bacterium]
MPYWQLVSRSFAIAWRQKYLWLLALFAGESGGASFNSGTSQPIGSTRGKGNAPDFSSVPHQVSNWFSQNLGLVVVVAVLFVLLLIAFFVLAAVCEGAVVRASAEHDAERPFGLRLAWRCGVQTMGTVIRLRLLLLVLVLPVLIVLLALFAGFLVALSNHNVGAAVAVGLVGLLVVLAAIPYSIYLGFLNLLGARAAVLEQLGARAALVRGHHLVRKRLGRVLLVWLVWIATAFVVGLCAAVVLAILVVPASLLAVVAFTTGSAAVWIAVAIIVLILAPIVLIVEGFVLAQGSTYWTIAFRRLEIDQAPAYGYMYPQVAPPQGTA